jgi:hypothetical protein
MAVLEVRVFLLLVQTQISLVQSLSTNVPIAVQRHNQPKFLPIQELDQQT